MQNILILFSTTYTYFHQDRNKFITWCLEFSEKKYYFYPEKQIQQQYGI